LTTDQKVSGLNPDGVTKPARTVRAFSCEDAKQACLILRMSTKKQKQQRS
jgi:hypothetical protein